MTDLTPELLALLKLFESSTRPLTARRIAEKTQTYPATALRRVGALQQHLAKTPKGKQVRETQYREGKRGPVSTAWVLS